LPGAAGGLLKRISGCREKIRKETPTTEPVAAAATISLFFSSQKGIACNALPFNVVADVEKLGFVLGAEERLLALAKNYQFTPPPLGLSDPPPLGARAPHLGTLPLDRSPRTTSLRAHLQRLCYASAG